MRFQKASLRDALILLKQQQINNLLIMLHKQYDIHQELKGPQILSQSKNHMTNQNSTVHVSSLWKDAIAQ
ncbi:hypothetical protein FGO68_gene3934 [Halteria grandinella]|uniref:Uncharacterized protein n=1 Tax=Halteria grandinella TaxID=5974 RepID=A0A8J8P0Z4_HALGN|nr:hypothetical protein FGO68_gene3934 [Halteria grandinella]